MSVTEVAGLVIGVLLAAYLLYVLLREGER